MKPDDYVQRMFLGDHFDVLQNQLSSRNAHLHKWYYFPEMTKDEVLVFKQWDSDPHLSGRMCFHTAFKDPSAPDDAPARQSIECRIMVFFPDHEPNTCPPPLSVAATGTCNEDAARDGAQKISGALDDILSNKSTLPMVYGFMRNMYTSAGARVVLAEFAEDQEGLVGLYEASTATKARAVELCMERGLDKKVEQIFAVPGRARL